MIDWGNRAGLREENVEHLTRQRPNHVGCLNWQTQIFVKRRRIKPSRVVYELSLTAFPQLFVDTIAVRWAGEALCNFASYIDDSML